MLLKPGLQSSGEGVDMSSLILLHSPSLKTENDTTREGNALQYFDTSMTSAVISKAVQSEPKTLLREVSYVSWHIVIAFQVTGRQGRSAKINRLPQELAGRKLLAAGRLCHLRGV